MGNLQKFIRGQVWWQKPAPIRQPGIQSDGRPVVIISNNAGNRFSPAITVIPFTTADKKPLPTHVKVLMEDGKVSTVLCEQLRTISTDLLEGYIGTLDDTKLTEIEGATLIALGFKQPEVQKEIELPAPETTILIDTTPTITLNPEPIKNVALEEKISATNDKTEDYAVISSHNRAKKFSKREKEMILRYLGAHSIIDTAKYFAPIYNIDLKKMYTRVCNIKNRNKK